MRVKGSEVKERKVGLWKLVGEVDKWMGLLNE